MFTRKILKFAMLLIVIMIITWMYLTRFEVDERFIQIDQTSPDVSHITSSGDVTMPKQIHLKAVAVQITLQKVGVWGYLEIEEKKYAINEGLISQGLYSGGKRYSLSCTSERTDTDIIYKDINIELNKDRSINYIELSQIQVNLYGGITKSGLATYLPVD